MPFTISSSVGDNEATNKQDDLRLIQMLLNRVSSSKGGPNPKLVTDGLIGSNTIGAIKRFQEHHQLPVVDGRIDPNASSINKLNEVLQIPPEGLVPVPGIPDPNIPLAPAIGGQSIGLSALQPGDLIVSASDSWTSKGIRFASDSSVSHVMVYLGADELGTERVAEAVVPKLRYGFLTSANGEDLSRDDENHAFHDVTLATAFRYQPGLSQEQVNLMTSFADANVGKTYNFLGVVLQPVFDLDLGTWCEAMGTTAAEAAEIVKHVGSALQDVANPLGISIDELFDGLADVLAESSVNIAKRCYEWRGLVTTNKAWNGSMFCSEFVLMAYEAAGVPLTDKPPQWVSPQDVVELRWSGKLGYVGHLIS